LQPALRPKLFSRFVGLVFLPPCVWSREGQFPALVVARSTSDYCAWPPRPASGLPYPAQPRSAIVTRVPSRQEIKILKLPYDSCTAALLWAAPLPPESPVPAILPFVTPFVGRCIVQSAAQRAVQCSTGQLLLYRRHVGVRWWRIAQFSFTIESAAASSRSLGQLPARQSVSLDCWSALWTVPSPPHGVFCTWFRG